MSDPTIEQAPENGQASEFQFDATSPTGLADAGTAHALPEAPAETPLAPGEERFPLPSGVVCLLRPGKGRDLLAAQRMAGTDPNQVMYGVIAVLAKFDGQKKVLEDVLDMPLGDVMTLMGKVSDLTGGDFLSTTAPSSTSQP